MYAMQDDDVFLSPESIIRSVMSAADLRSEAEAPVDTADDQGWARHARVANGFGTTLR